MKLPPKSPPKLPSKSPAKSPGRRDPAGGATNFSQEQKKDSSSPNRSRRMARSSQDMLALDLASNRTAVVVTPDRIISRKNSVSPNIEDLVIPVKRTSRDTLEDENGRVYPISHSIKQGGNGGIRFLLAPDKVLSQLYIVKEVPRGLAQKQSSGRVVPTLKLQIPSHPLVPAEMPTPQLHRPTNELERDEAELTNTREINYAHEINSPLAAHAVLRTEDTDYHLQPAGHGDMHEVWSSIYQTPPGDRKVLVKSFLGQLTGELARAHGLGLAHRDIKLTNIFFERSGHFHLGDLGNMSRISRRDSKIGTPEFQPLEVFIDPNHDTQKADVFALGVCVMALLTNASPLWPETREVPFINLRDPSLAPHERESLTASWASLLGDYRAAFEAGLIKSPSRLAKPTRPAPRLRGRVAEMHYKWSVLKEAHPEFYPIVRKMLHPVPASRPNADQLQALCAGSSLRASSKDQPTLEALLTKVRTTVQDRMEQEMPDMVSAKKSPDRLSTRMRRSHSFTVKSGLN